MRGKVDQGVVFCKQSCKITAKVQKRCSRVRKKILARYINDSSEEESAVDEECFYCNERYLKSKNSDGWIRCSRCLKWAHEACAGCDADDDYYIRELCF